VKTLQADAPPPPVAKRQSPADNTGVFRISLGKNEETRLDAFERKRAEKDSAGFTASKENKRAGS